jgi:hypothetical protein
VNGTSRFIVSPDPVTGTASCPSGTAIGGGAIFSNPPQFSHDVCHTIQSHRTSETEWTTMVSCTSGGGTEPLQFTPQVICMSLS